MPNYFITAVTMVDNRIARVGLRSVRMESPLPLGMKPIGGIGDVVTRTREEVVNLLAKGAKISTATELPNNQWLAGAEVSAYDDGFIRTEPSSVEADNLGNLPPL